MWIVLIVVAAACKAKSEKPAESGTTDDTNAKRLGPLDGRGGHVEPTSAGSSATPNEPTPAAPEDPNAMQAQTAEQRAQSITDGAALQFGKHDGAAIHDLPAGSGKPLGTITLGETAKLDDTSLTIETVATKIGSEYLASLVSCYRQSLAKEPALAGTVQLAWRVKADGTLERAKATAPTVTLGTCFEQAMTRWTFPIPTRRGKPTVAAFQTSVTLAAE